MTTMRDASPAPTWRNLPLTGGCLVAPQETQAGGLTSLAQPLLGRVGRAARTPIRADDSGLFWFFDSDNWELLVKVLDGCDINGRFWMLAAATTDVEYTLRVTDGATGVFREYFNPLGTASPAVVDTFETCLP